MDLRRVPRYLKASNRELLIEKMLQNNLVNQKEFHYFQIMKEQDGYVAWFYASDSTVIKKEENDTVKVDRRIRKK